MKTALLLGLCVSVCANKGYQCPGHSTAKYEPSEYFGDCECDTGYTKVALGCSAIEASAPAPAPQRTCQSAGAWEFYPGMGAWCTRNCNSPYPYCPSTHCTCSGRRLDGPTSRKLYVCPAHSSQYEPEYEPEYFGDCECDSGYVKVARGCAASAPTPAPAPTPEAYLCPENSADPNAQLRELCLSANWLDESSLCTRLRQSPLEDFNDCECDSGYARNHAIPGNSQGCTAIPGYDDSCSYANNGRCDVPNYCTFGTDGSDCPHGDLTISSSCRYANDGECDVPNYCDEGTDGSDCASTSSPTSYPTSYPTTQGVPTQGPTVPTYQVMRTTDCDWGIYSASQLSVHGLWTFGDLPYDGNDESQKNMCLMFMQVDQKSDDGIGWNYISYREYEDFISQSNQATEFSEMQETFNQIAQPNTTASTHMGDHSECGSGEECVEDKLISQADWRMFWEYGDSSSSSSSSSSPPSPYSSSSEGPGVSVGAVVVCSVAAVGAAIGIGYFSRSRQASGTSSAQEKEMRLALSQEDVDL